MKKIMLVLLALVLVGAAVSAQEAAPVAALTGYMYYSTNLYDSAGNVGSGPDWIAGGHYNNIGISYKAGAAGFSATIEYENNVIDTSFRDYTAWAKPFGDIVKVSAGKLRNGDYRLASYIDGAGFNSRISGYGTLVQVYPMADVSAGIFIPAGVDATAATAYGDVGIGVSYNIPDIAKAYIQYLLAADELFIGADVKAIAGMTLKLGYTGDFTAGSTFTKIWLTGGYGLMEGALDLGLDSYFNMATGTEIYAKVKAGYKVAEAITATVYGSMTSATTTTIGAGVGAVLAAGGNGNVYLSFDLSSGTATTWSIPVAVEIWF